MKRKVSEIKKRMLLENALEVKFQKEYEIGNRSLMELEWSFFKENLTKVKLENPKKLKIGFFKFLLGFENLKEISLSIEDMDYQIPKEIEKLFLNNKITLINNKKRRAF
jgi:hypothetical protein